MESTRNMRAVFAAINPAQDMPTLIGNDPIGWDDPFAEPTMVTGTEATLVTGEEPTAMYERTIVDFYPPMGVTQYRIMEASKKVTIR